MKMEIKTRQELMDMPSGDASEYLNKIKRKWVAVDDVMNLIDDEIARTKLSEPVSESGESWNEALTIINIKIDKQLNRTRSEGK